MGLVPIDAARWLPRKATDKEASRKRRLLETRHADVSGVAPGYDEEAERAACMVGCHFQAQIQTLDQAALLVPDDLCVMVEKGGRYHLAAAVLCSPSYWRLNDKLGQPLDAIHAGHEGLNERIGGRMSEFFFRLPGDRIFERRNWFLHNDDEPFHPVPLPEPPVDPSRLIVRSERQTLRRVDQQVVLFTIGVAFEPLSHIRRYPDAANEMLSAIATWSSEEKSAFGVRHFEAGLVEYLEGIKG